MLECCVAWLQSECINKLEECLEGEKNRILSCLKSTLATRCMFCLTAVSHL